MFGKVDNASDRHRRKSEHELYRCPDVFKGVASSFQKIHDIYGLGITLVEVFYWKRIDDIFKLPKGGSQAAVKHCQEYQRLASRRRSFK